ncbi:TetR/AcrR family transcriptional regulator [Hahella aquimaris]|uniref:TetR/AcrR family transcriptional regulator n=1 Tax=Hahella sp. HNIBRBA332 TaxID=3015983 RepID=UPI00273B18A6|nr:TetR/AcrR family transcriptional regulator [Hahella sp. HNIBRBA332]WLQ15859.1 TetR/AcrR family transcriptional regulator [Hahella sp. HNIBRBA332]
MTRRRQFTLENFISSARKIIQEQGPSKLTFDAVGKDLGCSRGAITHNFPTKRDLVVAIVDDMFMKTRELVEQEIEKAKDVPFPVLTGMILAIADESKKMNDFSQGIFQAAVAEEPPITEPFTRFYRDYWARIAEEAKDPIRALSLWTAIEGLILMDSYPEPAYSEKQRRELVTYLLKEASKD